MSQYTLLYTSVAKKSIRKLSGKGIKRVAEKVMLQLSQNPFSGKKLSGRLQNLYSERITRRYHVIYSIDTNAKNVYILEVAHRKESYKRR